MRTLAKILSAFIGIIAVAIAFVFYFTADMVTAANDFFLAIESKDTDKAYTYLSKDFRSGTSKAELEQYIANNSLTNVKKTSWNSRSISGGRGSLDGSVTTASGNVIPITINLVKEDNSWKIYAIQKPFAGVRKNSSSVQAPTGKEQIKLVADSMHIFAESVNEKSMARFHSHVSNLMQQKLTLAQFEEAFAAFYKTGVDLTVLDNLNPRFSAQPGIDENGVLLIAGYYSTKPNQVHFQHKYIYEGLTWKLIAFSTDIKKVAAS